MDSKRNKCLKKTYRNTRAKVQQYHEPEPEVFVLPPDILQKLGINLDKVDSNKKKPAIATDLPEISNIKKVCGSQTPVVANKELQEPQNCVAIKDVSLMKTAELMKNSVFLSPTFAPVTTNTSELESLALNNKTIEPTFNSYESIHDTVKCSDKLNNPQDHFSVTSNLIIPTNMTVNNVSPVEKNIDVTDESFEVSPTELPEELKGIRTDDHLDEAYLSDCSNSNLENMENQVIDTPENCKKITIISEEILTPYARDYSTIRNSEISNKLSLTCPVSKGSSESKATLENCLPATQNNFVSLSIKTKISSVPCYQNKVSKDKRNTEDADINNDCLSDCIDISVTDIEEHLKENEEVLQEFANEIISNDSSDIINKIERSEKFSEESNLKDNVINFIDSNNYSVTQYENDELFANGDDLNYYNKSNNIITDQENLENAISNDSNGFLPNLIHNIENNKLSVISNSESSFIGSNFELNSKCINSIDILPTQRINRVPQPLANMAACDILNTNENKGNSREENIAQNSGNSIQGKVEEISQYLKQCMNKLKDKSLTKAIETKELYPRKLNQKDLKSNQGVENPGGNQHAQSQHSTQKRPLKTYGKSTKKDVTKSTYPNYSSDPKHNKPETTSTLLRNEMSDIRLSDTTLDINFCLCYDFGRMDFYDSDIPYKHIHFWEQKVSNILPSTVFSILNDDEDCSFPNIDEDLANFQEDFTLETDSPTFNICWNSIECGNDICNVKQCINNSDKVQQDTHSVDQMIQVSDSTCNKCEIDISNVEQHCSENEQGADKDENTKLIPTKIGTEVDANIPDKPLESAVEQSQIDSLPIDESNFDTNTQKDASDNEIFVIQIQDDLESALVKETDNVPKAIALIEEEAHKTKGNNEATQKPPTITLDKEINQETEPGKTPENKTKKKKINNEATQKPQTIALDKEINKETDPGKAPENKTKKKKGNNEATQKPQTITLDMEINQENEPRKHPEIKTKKKKGNNESTQKPQTITLDKIIQENEPGKTPENKTKKKKKSFEPERKSRRFIYEDEIEDDQDQSSKSEKKETKQKRRRSSIQIGSDEEPLSIKKSRKQKSLDNKSPKSSNLSSKIVEVAVSKSGTEENKVQCGVCSQVVHESDWFQHIGKEHSYGAWKFGEPPVDMNNEEEFETHLKEIVKQTASLVCSKCGLTRKYVKPYLKHFNQCNGDINETIKLENVTLDFHDNADISANNEVLVECGVCNKKIQPEHWIKHIQMTHDYLAWKQGDSLDLDNPDAVNDHLALILKAEGKLICSKCGLKRKHIKLFMDHIKVCSLERTITDENYDGTTTAKEGTIVCAVCNEEVNKKKWIDHNMKKHYNLAWIQGDPPVVATALNVVEKLLKEYKNKNKELLCNVCGISRISYMGFYAHILVCGKSEERTEKFKIHCNICDKKYIFLYQKQHLAAHREQENAKERKLQAEIKKASQMAEQDAQDSPSGRRKAAEKARTVIEKYKENTAAKYKCEKCSFSSDNKKELNKHKCTIDAGSDAEPSAASESEDSYDGDVNSNVSDEEEENISAKKGKKCIVQSPVAKTKALPFVVNKPKEYIVKSGEEYYKTYLSSEGLFPEWRNMACEEISEQDMPSYMPPLKESCKLRISNVNYEGEWKACRRFEAMEGKGATVLFVGASIHCASWVPPLVKDSGASREESAFLAVSVHRGPDTPRFSADETHLHPALIQIWGFGNFKSLPKFVLGLAHDFGTVWSMDWCPSGARDAPDSDSPRLGLLATACSDGVVHIYSVPYPPSTENSDKVFYRINPVAELRISSASHRKLYQATAVRWCRQIGHAIIFVGYSDGTTAFYDLGTDSPLLRTTENGVTILYPYFDERAHTSCITGVSTFPCGARAGASISCASAGVRVTAAPAARPRRRATHHAATSADFEPLFPFAVFTTDSSTLLASPPELDWAGAGRRLGSLAALAGCYSCGLCLVYSPPQLRTLRPHPAISEPKKQCFGALDMILLAKKRKKPLKDDNLATIVEPTTYEDAIKKYGVEFRIDKDLKPLNSRQRVMYAERFPLATPGSMAFCPAPAHHDRVAIATHSGLIFVTIVPNRL